jgi:protocatechuate 3,4-dioxygenase beta subunit
MKWVTMSIVVLLGVGYVSFSRRLAPTALRTNQTQQPFVSASQSPKVHAAGCSGRALTEFGPGPYYKSNTPQRQDVREAGVKGQPLVLEGHVYDTNCRPIEGVVLDFWQADSEGKYDMGGYQLRGHQSTDKEGKYRLVTVIPGQYPGRTEHIHVRIQAPGSQKTIITQLFFPNGANDTDTIFDASMVVRMNALATEATYDFVIDP